MVHREPSRIGLHLLRVTIFSLLAFLTAALLAGTRYLDAHGAPPLPVARALPFSPSAAKAAPPEEFAISRIPVERKIRRGETISDLLDRLGLSGTETRQVIEALAEHMDVRRLRAGQLYTVFFDDSSRPIGLQLTLEDRARLDVERSTDGWMSTLSPFERRIDRRVIQGVLEGSLVTSIERAGAPAALAFAMAEVLQWDLDFNRDLRRGDRFEVVFGELYLDGEYHSLDQVLALRYDSLRDRPLEAYRYGDGQYYDGDGRPLRKMFLRSPLRFSRITSRFSHRRFHPILKRYRPHYGVDYGAPTGTPVQVTASGVVTFTGWQRGGGNVVKVRHPNGYLSAYLHLSRFAKGIRPGARVRQGDLVGHVGATGLATAPHLDYRVQKDGRWIDPLSIKSVRAEPIPAVELAEFERWRDLLRTSLDLGVPPPEIAAPPETRLASSAPSDLPAGGTVSGR